jgi:hypothetical protein
MTHISSTIKVLAIIIRPAKQTADIVGQSPFFHHAGPGLMLHKPRGAQVTLGKYMPQYLGLRLPVPFHWRPTLLHLSQKLHDLSDRHRETIHLKTVTAPDSQLSAIRSTRSMAAWHQPHYCRALVIQNAVFRQPTSFCHWYHSDSSEAPFLLPQHLKHNISSQFHYGWNHQWCKPVQNWGKL